MNSLIAVTVSLVVLILGAIAGYSLSRKFQNGKQGYSYMDIVPRDATFCCCPDTVLTLHEVCTSA
jgi:ABC-type spermidine/putrescine transport system permease subunit II